MAEHDDDTSGAAVARVRPARSETRRRVLDAAYAVFVERGIAASSLTDVADAAGLTKGAIYSNFAGKDELVLALMEERAMRRLTAALVGFTAADPAGDARCDDDAREPGRPSPALAEVGRVLIEAMRSDAGWHRLLAEYYAMSYHDPARREGLRLRRREARDAVARALTALAEAGTLPLPLSANETATVLFALSNGLAIETGIDGDAVADDLLGRVLALLVRGGLPSG